VLFWDITQRIVAIPYRRFGTLIGLIFKGKKIQETTSGRNYPLLCIIYQNSLDVFYFASEA